MAMVHGFLFQRYTVHILYYIVTSLHPVFSLFLLHILQDYTIASHYVWNRHRVRTDSMFIVCQSSIVVVSTVFITLTLISVVGRDSSYESFLMSVVNKY